MNIGVSTAPWGNTKRPTRAQLVGSVARREKDTLEPCDIGQMPAVAKPNRLPAMLREIRIISDNPAMLAGFYR
jgi:hypothetical protein